MPETSSSSQLPAQAWVELLSLSQDEAGERAMLERGLELVELHVMQRTRAHASGAALLDFMEASAFGTFLKPVPDELRASLRADLIAAFDSQRGPEGIALRGWGVLLVAQRPFK